ncbi:MAG TPA: radical SAM family heme chaperone HemW [Nitrospirales bacterium]|nr:radical SAM family heme chaperone HemW [Nitrospirales bacterium]
MTLRQDSVGLYLHIPFCERICAFCAFVTRGYREPRAAAFVSDLMAEIRLSGREGRLRGRPVETIYFGGGTPTTLSADQLLQILDACRENFSLDPAGEIAIEANPATVEGPALRALRQGGFSRISYGAQSFDDAELKAVGAPHTVEEIRGAVGMAREAGFANLNLDLIYGLPGQSPARWAANLEAAISLEPEHLSFYGLTIEEGSRLHRERGRGCLAMEADEVLADMYRRGQEALGAAGYVQYEVSNFCRPGYACRHNLRYWTDQEWVGFGPGAHSYLDRDRFSNVVSLEAYHRMVTEGVLPIAEREPGTPDLRLREAMAFGLRMVGGVRVEPLESRYGVDPLDRFRDPIERMTRDGWLILEDGVLRPSLAGIMFTDSLAASFL